MHVVRISMVFAAGIAASSFGQASFTPLGDLAGGAFTSGALGISADGTKVVGYATDASGTRAVSWNNGAIALVADPSGDYTPRYAFAISASGVIVGAADGPSGPEAFKYNPSGANRYRALGGTAARGISANGNIVVGYREQPDGSNLAGRWDGPTFSGLGYLDELSPGSAALGISSNGSVVVGGSSTPDGVRAFAIYNNEGFLTPLANLEQSTQSEALAASANGSVIVGTNLINGQFVPVRWTNGSIQQLPALAGVTSVSATACSADGSVVIGYGLENNQLQAVVWRGGQTARIKDVLVAANINLAGWRLGTATGLSADGKWVCGSGAGPSGNEAWVARLPDLAPPCPVDFNGDGFLDFFDYDDYVRCFEGSSCPPSRTADFNGDAFVDFFDYDDFVSAFETGC